MSTRKQFIRGLWLALAGTAASAQDKGGVAAGPFASKQRDIVSVKDFGAIGDGLNHPLSERYATLAAAQAVYPHARALSQSVDWAAFQAAHNSLSAPNSHVGGEIFVPSGSYHLSSTWAITKRVWIRGTQAGDQKQTAATILHFPADTDGLRFYSSQDSATGTDATTSRVTGIQVEATARNASGVGIKCTTAVRIDHCIVRDFKSHGIEFHGQTGAGATGICDFWKVANTRILTCGGHGLYHHGNDAQLGVAEQVEAMANGGWGFYNDSPYTSTYIACQASGNASGAYFYSGTMTYQGSILIGCYAEAGRGSNCSLTDGCIVVGGTIDSSGATALQNGYPGGSGINASATGRIMFWRNNVEVGRIETDNTLRNFPGAHFGTSGYLSLLNANAGRMDLRSTGTGSELKLVFLNGNGTAGSVSTNGSATAYNTSSDYRLKENVRAIPGPEAIEKIMRLRPVTFVWKKDGSPAEGFIAHELQEVFPQAVTGQRDATEEVAIEIKDDAGNVTGSEAKVMPRYQGVDSSFLVPALIAMVQEQQGQLDALARRIAMLEEPTPVA
jgi:hypothetical protein